MRMELNAKSPWSSNTSFNCFDVSPSAPTPSHETTSLGGKSPENGLPQKTESIVRSVSVLAGILTKCWRVSWPQREKAHSFSSMSPPLPPGRGVSNVSQNAGFSKPQLPGGATGGISVGKPTPPAEAVLPALPTSTSEPPLSLPIPPIVPPVFPPGPLVDAFELAQLALRHARAVIHVAVMIFVAIGVLLLSPLLRRSEPRRNSRRTISLSPIQQTLKEPAGAHCEKRLISCA